MPLSAYVSPLPFPLAGPWWLTVIGHVQKAIIKEAATRENQSNQREGTWDPGRPLKAQLPPQPWTPYTRIVLSSQIYFLTNRVGPLRGLQGVIQHTGGVPPAENRPGWNGAG